LRILRKYFTTHLFSSSYAAAKWCNFERSQSAKSVLPALSAVEGSAVERADFAEIGGKGLSLPLDALLQNCAVFVL
jgi:hypothetical protein